MDTLLSSRAAAGMCCGSHSTSFSICGIGCDLGPAPAADLPVEVIAGLAVVGEAALGELHGMQRGDHAVHLVVDRIALLRRKPGQGLVPQHAALLELHDVERAADDGFV